jgi:hypothetical protein
MTKTEHLALQAVRLENALFLRWFTANSNHAAPEYVARLSAMRRKALARVFRRQG